MQADCRWQLLVQTKLKPLAKKPQWKKQHVQQKVAPLKVVQPKVVPLKVVQQKAVPLKVVLLKAKAVQQKAVPLKVVQQQASNSPNFRSPKNIGGSQCGRWRGETPSATFDSGSIDIDLFFSEAAALRPPHDSAIRR